MTVINGIECYGKAELGANYDIVFDDEFKDFVATGIEATSWTEVVRQLSMYKGIVQIEAC